MARSARLAPKITRDDLLAPVKRWYPHRKLKIAEGVRCGVISIGEASRTHNIAPEELTRWCDAARRGKLHLLAATYRRPTMVSR